MEIKNQSIVEDDALSFLPYGVATFENDEQNVRWCQAWKNTACEFCFDQRYMDEGMLTMPLQYFIEWSMNNKDEGKTTKT